MHTYLLSDGKVATIIVDIVIIFDKLARGEIPLSSQTIARRTRGSGVEHAQGLVLSRAQFFTGREGSTACWHRKNRSIALPD